MKKLIYNPNALESFSKEWGIHEKCKEWWYATGVLFDDDNNLYSYQYTILNINFGIFTAKIAMLALTDYKNNRHYYLQCPQNKQNKLYVDDTTAQFGEIIGAKKEADHMSIFLRHKDFSLDLKANYGKGVFWHCDNGKLQMGIAGEKETTLYYSYTNMPTEGVLTINGEEIRLHGKTWFDKQGGTYSIANSKTHWEWFSLRFFDDEEMMLFTFPQDDYFDGTYITKDAQRERLQDYTIKSTSTTRALGLKWSSSWDLYVNKKEKHYTIVPIQEGHMNFAYFEELCYIKNGNGDVVGYCFVELLPGVLNGKNSKPEPGEKKGKIKLSNLFKRIEY